MAVPKYRDILSLHLKNVSNVKIAEVCECSRTTVISVLKVFDQRPIDLEKIDSMTDVELKHYLYPRKEKVSGNKPDVKAIAHELDQHKDLTLKQLWVEYLDDCAEKKIAPLMYSRYCYHYQQHTVTRRAKGHVSRHSGFSIEVDWGGSTMQWQDVRTGEILIAYLFVGCLSYSRYTYCEAFSTQNTDSWISAHNHMFSYFGGSTKILICDNLKTGIIKHIKGETQINRTYQEMARHYHTVISAAAVRHPKGKPNVEDSVGIIANNIIAALRHKLFYSLAEINQAIREKIEEINGSPFQQREGSRKILFEQVECSDLQKLPATPFEMADWHTGLTVQYNYHIRIDKWFYYSVPYQYINRTVSVRVTLSVVEIFLAGSNQRIATHQRNYNRRDPYQTEPAHMPKAHQEAQAKWNERRFLSWAQSIGSNTCTVVSGILNSRQIIQQAYPACMAMLNLSKTYGEEQLECICSQIVTDHISPSYSNVKNMLAATATPSPPKKVGLKKEPKGFLRHSAYFSSAVQREVNDDEK